MIRLKYMEFKKIICFISIAILTSQSFCPLFAATKIIEPAVNTNIVQELSNASLHKTESSIAKTLLFVGLGLSLPFILALIGQAIERRRNRPPQIDPDPNQTPQERERKRKEKLTVKKFSVKREPFLGLGGGFSCSFPLTKTETKLDDLVGSKSKDAEILIKQYKEPEKFKNLGCSMPTAIIIEGPPGTGKTSFVRGLANEVDAYLFELSGSYLKNKLIGESGKLVREIFSNSRELAQYTDKPVFILIDEIDAALAGLGTKSGGTNAVAQELLSSINYELSAGRTKNEGITVFATTNNAEQLANSLTRAGRFKIIKMNIPNTQDKIEIFKKYAQERPSGLAEEIDNQFFETELTDKTQGLTGSDIEQIFELGAFEAVANDQEKIKKENIFEAIKKINIKKEIQISKSKFAPEKTTITLNDLVGSLSPEIERLVAQLKNPQQFTRVGATIPQAILLWGPPGTGKTTLVKAIANEIDAQLFVLSGSDLTSKWIGGTKDNINLIFENARTLARNTGKKSIILLDEFDGAFAGLQSNCNNVSAQSALSKLKFELTQTEDRNKNVYLFATSNHPNSFPEALTRPGRLIKIKVGLPEESDREEIFKYHAEQKPIDDEVKDEEFFKEIASEANEFSGADLKQIMENAAQDAGFKQQETIKRQNILDGLQEMKKYVRRQKTSHKKQLRQKETSPFDNVINHLITKHIIKKEENQKRLKKLTSNLNLT